MSVPATRLAPIAKDTRAASTPVEAARQSYSQILKSSALIGGSSLANVVIGMVRTKVMAVILGPAGVGLLGVYGSVVDLASTVAGMGVNSSGVRQMAESVATGDASKLARTALVLRRTSLILGIIGSCLLFASAWWVSEFTFGTPKRTFSIGLLAIAVLLRLLSNGQGALLQGMRRISDLARVNVFSALFGTLAAIPLVYFMQEDGVAPALVAIAVANILSSWWYSHKVDLPKASVSPSDLLEESAPLLRLGLAFMASGLMMMGSAYLIRILLLRVSGVTATGLYHAAWTVGGLYVNFILQAMGADFFPRLTAISHDNTACNRLVNEQTRIGLLLSGPGALITLTLAPWVISCLYTREFSPAVEVLRWVCLGAAIRVLTWPIGFIILAKGRSHLFFWSDFVYSAAHVALAWLSISNLGVTGAGVAFFASYVVHAAIVYPIAAGLTGFRWSRENRRTGFGFLSAIAVVFCSYYILSPLLSACVGIIVTLVGGIYGINVLGQLTSWPAAGSCFARMAGLCRLPLPR